MDLFNSEYGPWNGYRLSKDVFCGGYPGDLNPSVVEGRLLELVEVGVKSVFDLTEHGELSTAGAPLVPYAAVANKLEMICYRSAIVDNDIPTFAQMRGILRALLKAEKTGKVYLHCRGGIGRTGTVACCYLLAKKMAQPHNVFYTLELLREPFDCWGASPELGRQRRFVLAWWAKNEKHFV